MTKNKSKKSKKVPIEEVDNSAPEVIENKPQVIEVKEEILKVEKEEKQSAPAPAKPAKVSAPKAKMNAKELIGVVKKTPFDANEAQTLIDILLNKSSGLTTAGENWVEKPSTKAKNTDMDQVKALKKELEDKVLALREQEDRNKSITDRMNLLRQELNQAKSGLVSHQRIHGEMQQRHQQEMGALQATLEQERDASARNLSHLQGQLQFQITANQSLTATLEQQTMAVPSIDPKLYSELESLRAAKANFDTERANLQGQVSQLEEDKAKEVANVEKSVKELTEKVGKMEKDKTRLTEENERLAEQLVANVERPKAEGQESKLAAQTNGVHVEQVDTKMKEEAKMWQNKFQNLEKM